MVDLTQKFREPCVPEQPTVRENMNACVWQPIAAMAHDRQKPVLQKCRLPSGNAEFRGRGRNQFDQAEVLEDAIAVVDLPRRL